MTGTTAARLLLDRYTESELLDMFAQAGVLAAVESRGFCALRLEINDGADALTHVHLHGSSEGEEHLLIDACLSLVRLDEASSGRCGYAGSLPVDFLVVYWLREQDPTSAFDAAHPRLPLQQHPGLGVLRRAFQVAIAIAKDLDRDGIAALPKFFHDASIFWHSRLFLFLDPREQGRFEALLRDLQSLPLADASLALACSAVRDVDGNAVAWNSGFQVMPLSAALTDWFHSPAWQDACRKETEASRFTVDAAELERARGVFRSSNAPANA